jgi:hypothetical protein
VKKQSSSAKHNADRAYNLGYKAATNGEPITSNPFVTERVIGLHRWWEKGWREADSGYVEEIKGNSDADTDE